MTDPFVALQKHCRALEHRLGKNRLSAEERARLLKEWRDCKERLAQMIKDKEAQ